MENYQIIIDINNISKKDESYSYLFNIFDCYNIDFLKKLTNKSSSDKKIDKDLKLFINKNKIDIKKVSFKDTEFLMKLYINRFINNDIKYIKSNSFTEIHVELITYKTETETEENIIGIKLNDYCHINKELLNENVEKFVEDKKNISEWIKNCVQNIINFHVIKSTNLIQFNNIIMNYENYFNKPVKNPKLDILPYISLYNSLILRFEILNNSNKIVTFLPVSRQNCKNLFIKYQKIFKLFSTKKSLTTETTETTETTDVTENTEMTEVVVKNNDEEMKELSTPKVKNNGITFKNPKNEKHFNSDSKVEVENTNLQLSLRLYCSKINNLQSYYYRKTTESLDIDVFFLLKNYEKTKKIVGVKFGEIDYYIWKNDGNLETYETYLSSKDYNDFTLNVFKDSCIFYYKLIG
jgi:hypothetical protein